MKKFILLNVLLLFFSCGKELKIATDNQDSKNGQITQKQSELIFEKIKFFPNKTQISIAIIENKRVNFYGVKREKDKIISIENHDRVFEIGSISKVFTSTLLASLVLDNKIHLEDNISDYLGIELNNEEKLTFKELANHTSGMPRLAQNRGFGLFLDKYNPYKDYGEEKLLEYITEKMELGEKKWAYSNVGVALLGYTLTKVANKSYQDLLSDRIFTKYEMKNSTTKRKNIENRLVKGLNQDGDVTPNWDMAIHVGAGGILSTVEDLSKFAIAQFNSKNIELELTRKKTHEIRKGRSVALGWHKIKNENMNEFYSHNGGTGGYTSSIAVDVENENGVIILSNVSSYHNDYESIISLCYELFNTL
ncbi:serine hydrolase domain-containing protein [Aquimarina sp. 2201CG14-23]|uniref:serine hydrolase domain-containing protein n=1 Tax=Aquimarina mycalae TaxID=3040073 RepID=UPI002477E85B|nr:serine hydrolase domain-containing protein [Aquimarina sp. 2201CG14-23]MDH7448462.1 serine hydrolase domain-containing protein [Aquimarina sp. 2201CG14-23]